MCVCFMCVLIVWESIKDAGVIRDLAFIRSFTVTTKRFYPQYCTRILYYHTVIMSAYHDKSWVNFLHQHSANTNNKQHHEWQFVGACSSFLSFSCHYIRHLFLGCTKWNSVIWKQFTSLWGCCTSLAESFLITIIITTAYTKLQFLWHLAISTQKTSWCMTKLYDATRQLSQ